MCSSRRRTQRRSIAILVPFTIYSTWVTLTEGYLAFFTLPWSHAIWTQEFLDLCIALFLVCSWIVVDGRERGATVWPYLVATPLLGSIAPLTYLAMRSSATSAADEAPARRT